MKPYKLSISKPSQRHLDTRVMKAQLEKITSRMLGGGRGRVWGIRFVLAEPAFMHDSSYLYTCSMTIKRTGRDVTSETYNATIAYMLAMGQKAGNASGWTFGSSAGDVQSLESDSSQVKTTESSTLADEFVTKTKIDGDESEPALPAATEPNTKGYSSRALSIDVGEHFSHIYERDAQIAVIQSAVKAFVDSDFYNRFHCVLWGEPACGKTEILRSFTRMLGANFVLELDATSTTKAGAERLLLESKTLPPVLVCEEIEKTDENSLRRLLGVLDHRGEIRKTTHNMGLRHRDVKMLCLATVNDMALFKRAMDGALASRFSHKVWCPRPSKDVLKRILAREIARMPNGNQAWIEPAVDWCVDVELTNDPRRVTTVCLSGRDALLTGEYQKLLAAVSEPGERTAVSIRSSWPPSVSRANEPMMIRGEERAE